MTLQEIESELINLTKQMRKHLQWEEFNPRKRKDVVEALYIRCELPVTRCIAGTRKPSTAYKALLELDYHPFAEMMFRYTVLQHEKAKVKRCDAA